MSNPNENADSLKILGTSGLREVISGTSKAGLGHGCSLEWSVDDHFEIDNLLSNLGLEDPQIKNKLLGNLERMLLKEGHTRKFPPWIARKSTESPYGSKPDRDSLKKAQLHLQKAISAIEDLGLEFGLRYIPGNSHPLLLSVLEGLESASTAMQNDFPKTVHGKRRFDKWHKKRWACDLAWVFKHSLGIQPTSTMEGPFYSLFVFVNNALGFKGVGKWEEYYPEALKALSRPIPLWLRIPQD